MKWEYRTIRQSLAAAGGSSKLDTELERLGNEGWEAVSMTSATTAVVLVLLKRPVAA